MALEGLRLRPIKRKPKAEEPKKRFNFGTSARAEGNVKDIAWLKNKTKQELVFLWKIGNIKKKFDAEDKVKFDEIKHYLKNKFNVEIPK